jgi:hypothetical protein
MREEEESKERWSIEKWNSKWYSYERKRKIKRTMMNWGIKLEIRLFWEKKKDQKNDDQSRSETGSADCYERRRNKRTMMNWEVKCEIRLLWKKNSDHKNNNQLRSEKGSSNVMREEGSKERRSIEKWNMKCDCYDRIVKWEVKWKV